MNRIVRYATLAAAALGAVAPIAARAQSSSTPTVAIMPFNNNVFNKDARNYDGLSKGVADFLITEMAGNRSIRVIERDQVQKLIEEQGLAKNGVIDQATAVRAGKLLGAQHMIFGGFMADPNNNFRIDARSVNVESGAIEHTERVQDKGDNVMGLIGQLAERLNTGLKLPGHVMRTGEAAPAQHPTQVAAEHQAVATQAGAPARAAQKIPMRVAIMYGKALDLKDRGQKDKAVELFSAVLREFPDFADAQREQAKLKAGA